MPLSVSLELDDRQDDRVYVTVSLKPNTDPIPVGGVGVQLRTRTGECLSSRMLLPISGVLSGPLSTKVELRAFRGIPRDAEVVSWVWWGDEELQATCPVDPCTQLEVFVRGSRILLPPDKSFEVTDLQFEERDRLVQQFQWMRSFRSCPHKDPECSQTILDEEQCIEDFVGDMQDQLGIDEGCAAWVRDLLREDLEE